MPEVGEMTEEQFAAKHAGGPEHPAGCVYGGFSCGYWLVVDGCPMEHWEQHYVRGGVCPCGDEFPGFGTGVVFMDATEGVPADG